MAMNRQTGWTEEAEVVVVGYGGAGAVAAIAAHDAGAKVLIVEKQPRDSPTETRHTPNTRMAGGGGWLWPTDAKRTIQYLEGLARISNETVDAERKELFSVLADYLVSNVDWIQEIGVPVGGEESIGPTMRQQPGTTIVDGRVFNSDFPELPGSESCSFIFPKPSGKYRGGAAFFKYLSEAVQKRGIPVMWE
ncbi:MAG: FAD-binding protein, partial [Chloroflexi bacterium]|nr:FAD-binding protein [Chloroflexota bacterium]